MSSHYISSSFQTIDLLSPPLIHMFPPPTRKNPSFQQQQPLRPSAQPYSIHNIASDLLHSTANHKTSKSSSRFMYVFSVLTLDSVPVRVTGQSSGLWSEGLVVQSCPTLYDPMDCSPPGSSVYGILQASILEWLPFLSPGDFPKPGIKPCLIKPRSPTFAGRFFTIWARILMFWALGVRINDPLPLVWTGNMYE